MFIALFSGLTMEVKLLFVFENVLILHLVTHPLFKSRFSVDLYGIQKKIGLFSEVC
jgi:hypothetical protein